MRLPRLFKHWLTSPWAVRSAFPARSFAAIEQAIRTAERLHGGEIRFAVEAALATPALLRRQSARERAVELFSHLRIWDTECNNGVLVYVLLADRAVEIVADRGIHELVGAPAWQGMCQNMEDAFFMSHYRVGALQGIKAVAEALMLHFPPRNRRSDEQPFPALPSD